MACNFIDGSTLCQEWDNSCCNYSELNFDCLGNCIAEIDCFGICGGGANVDECGVCAGGGMAACALYGEEVCDLDECTIYYNVYKMEDGVDGTDKIVENMTGTEFTETGFEYINTFSYYVTYIDAWGNESSHSNTADARPIVFPDFAIFPFLSYLSLFFELVLIHWSIKQFPGPISIL